MPWLNACSFGESDSTLELVSSLTQYSRRVLLRVRTSDAGQQVAVRWRMTTRPSRAAVQGVRVELDSSWPEQVLDGIYLGSYEAPEANVLISTLRPDDRYFEIGASIGVMMTIACRIVGDQNVTAVEANPALIAKAVRTAEINGHRPTVINAVLSVDGRPRPFYVRNEFWESSLLAHPDAREVEVPGRIFAHELAESQATYLMVDIEGGEIELLEPPLPLSIRAVCMEVHPDLVSDESVQHLLQQLMDQGFTLNTRFAGPQVVFLERSPG